MSDTEDMSKFKYLVLDAAVDSTTELKFVCTYCGNSAHKQHSIVHHFACPAPMVFNSLSKKPIDSSTI